MNNRDFTRYFQFLFPRNLQYILFLIPFLSLGADPQLNSPYKTIYNHLYFLQGGSYNPDQSARSFMIYEKDAVEAIRASIQLKQLLDGMGIYIDPDEVPRQTNYFDSLSGKKHRYVLSEKLPGIYVERIDESWLYPNRVLTAIDYEHKQVFKFGTDRLLTLLPKLGTREFMGLLSWQYVGLLMLVFLCFLFHKVALFFLDKIIVRILRRMGYEDVARKYIKPVSRPASLLLVIFILMLFLPVIQLPVYFARYLMMTLRASMPLTAAIIFYKFIDVLALYFARLASRTDSSLDDQLVPLIRKTLKTFVIIIGTLLVLETLDVPILPLLTGLSIGGLAFALAAQDTIKNFFGSLMIFIDKPFQIGDWVSSGGDIDGTVEEVGLRSTRIRTFRNSLTYIPNGKLADRVVDNHGLRRYRRFYTKIGITYDTPPHLIETFVTGLERIVQNHPNTWKDNYHVYLNNFNSSSLDIMFYIFFSVPTWGEELKCRHEVMLRIITLANELGVRFAFPTQTMHMETFPEKQSLAPEFAKSPEFYVEKMDELTRK